MLACTHNRCIWNLVCFRTIGLSWSRSCDDRSWIWIGGSRSWFRQSWVNSRWSLIAWSWLSWCRSCRRWSWSSWTSTACSQRPCCCRCVRSACGVIKHCGPHKDSYVGPFGFRETVVFPLVRFFLWVFQFLFVYFLCEFSGFPFCNFIRVFL